MTQLTRHIANLGLLLAFTTLAVTGVMSFVLPFSITTTRVHIVFGAATVLLVGLHLATRLNYFTRIAKQSVTFRARKKPQVPRWLVAMIAIVWAGLLYASLAGMPPASSLIGVGYEAQYKVAIFRADPQTVYEQVGPTNRVASVSAESGGLVIAVEVEYREPVTRQPAAAIWAQTTRAHMIQTLFVDEKIAYSDTPKWHGRPTPRHHILPIWRHTYTDINGVDPTGDTHAVTSATPKHSFSVEQSLAGAEGKIVICLEINAHGDANDAYPDKHLGQPSVLYTALIDLEEDQGYYLMVRTAHGGGAELDGDPRYNFDGLTTSKDLIEKVLVQVKRPGRE